MTKQSGGEEPGKTISPAPEDKMRFLKTLNAVFGVGAPQENLDLLAVLRAGVLSIEKLSPGEVVYDLGGNDAAFNVLVAQGAFPFMPPLTPVKKIIRVNGATITAMPDGIIAIDTPVQLKAPAAEKTPKESGALAATVTKQAYNIGDVLPDGWVVGPRSPKTGIVMAIEPVSGALDGYRTWYRGEDHAADLRGKGHANARQPSADGNNDELNAIYNEVVKAGRNGNAKLNTSGSNPYGRYWSGTTDPDSRDDARMQYLNGGYRLWSFKGDAFARVRCVRDEPGLTLA